MMERTKPLFVQVYEDIRGRIVGGEFPIDSRLPTEGELMERYKVSITTVRKAVQTLSDSGVVAKRQGMGTFVIGYPSGGESGRGSVSRALKVAVLLPSTMRLTKEGDSRHWALNLRRLNGIYAAAAAGGCSVFVHSFAERLDFASFDGVIMMPSYAVELEAEDLRLKILSELDAAGIPAVTVSEFDPRFASKWWVAEMIELEFFKAARHLLSSGHRRVALIGPKLAWANPRYSGYRKALEAEGARFDESLVVENPASDEASGKAACAGLLGRLGRRRPDAIFCTTDLQAYGAMSCLLEKRLRIPEEVSLLGVDNLPESSACAVPLSSVEFSGPEVGEAAFFLLSEAIDGRHPGGRMISCPGRIIERDSISQKNMHENRRSE